MACGTTEAVNATDFPASGIEITVVLPPDWPDPTYSSPPNVVIHGAANLVFPVATDRITVRLPSEGDYTFWAVANGGSCSDTARMVNRDDPPPPIVDGDLIELRATGEVCD